MRKLALELWSELYFTSRDAFAIICTSERKRYYIMKKFTEQEIAELKKQAKKYIPGRVDYYAAQMHVSYGRIAIRCQKTRWGSCSQKGNLNFNCLLMKLPPEIIDYVVVHELCHRLQMNHSPKFWAEVEKVLPDYKKYRKWLKEFRF